eukprot:4184828-Alexandrium_andersonii.AAC.1
MRYARHEGRSLRRLLLVVSGSARVAQGGAGALLRPVADGQPMRATAAQCPPAPGPPTPVPPRRHPDSRRP